MRGGRWQNRRSIHVPYLVLFSLLIPHRKRTVSIVFTAPTDLRTETNLMLSISKYFPIVLLVPYAAGFSTNYSSNPRTSLARTSLHMGLFDTIFGGGSSKPFDGACVIGEEGIMSPKAHGTSATPVQSNLRWDCDEKVADNICNFNRHYAEFRGYWKTTTFIEDAKSEYEQNGEIKFHDSNTGKLLFVAPKGRSFEEFMKESLSHGWPSFRDDEVVWDDVRCLPNGEAVSLAGTHLGHNLPDFSGNRYCINLVSVAGNPVEEK